MSVDNLKLTCHLLYVFSPVYIPILAAGLVTGFSADAMFSALGLGLLLQIVLVILSFVSGWPFGGQMRA
jgi:hypothetical protein